jgi:peptidoglycan-N-acetylglucosamine deacetylase
VTDRAMEDAEISAGEVTRRRLLRLGLAGAAGAAGLAVAGCGEAHGAQGGLAFAERSLLPSPKPTATPAVTPKPVQRRSRPVYTLQDFTAKPPANAVALTIDDGPSPRWTPMMLDLLRRYRVLATFCLIGQQVRQRPDLARRIVDEGHTLCNHTMSHPHRMGRMSASRVEHEIAEASGAIADATGLAPRVFRSPGGDWGPAVFSTVARHGMVPIDWSVDPRDWATPGVKTIARRLMAAKPGQILLCHDGGGNRSETVAALNTVIPALQRRGLRFVTL